MVGFYRSNSQLGGIEEIVTAKGPWTEITPVEKKAVNFGVNYKWLECTDDNPFITAFYRDSNTGEKEEKIRKLTDYKCQKPKESDGTDCYV